MPYQDEFELFWEQVTQSAEEGRFAKLTMAKTIGKPNLRNVFIRPIYSKGEYKVLVKLRYRSRETEDVEEEYTLNQAYEIVKSHILVSFLSVLLFTTTKDITFKVNKKGAGSMTEGRPTFSEVVFAEKEV